MYHCVTSVNATEGHRLIVGFDNGETRVFDVTPLLATGRFRELRSQDLFGKVKVVFDTVAWDNGLDLDPEYVYAQSLKLADCPRQNRHRAMEVSADT